MATQLEDFVYGQWGKKVDFYEFAGSPPVGLQPSKEAFGYDTINNKWYQWDKTNWNELGSGGGLTTVSKNSSFTASKNNFYLVNTSSSAITITPPNVSLIGDIFEVMDVKGTSSTNNIIITFTSIPVKLESASDDFIFNDNIKNYFRFVYSGDTTIGWHVIDLSGTSGIDNLYSVDGSIGVGGDPNANAILDLQSTTKGFLPPRLSSVQRNAISSPANGLMVYDSDLQCLMIYLVDNWVQI